MPVDTIDLDPEIKAKIDNMSREELEAHLREEDPTSELRQGVAGEYFEERFKGATGMTSDDFNRQMRLEAEKDDDEELGEVDDEEDQDDGEDAPVLG